MPFRQNLVTVLPNGSKQYIFSFDAPWNDEGAEALRIVASSGAKLSANFEDEEYATWMYSSESNTGILITDSLVKIPLSELNQLRAAHTTLNSLRMSLGHPTITGVSKQKVLDDFLTDLGPINN